MHLRVSLAAVAALSVAAAPAAAKPKPITGSLSKAGYSVLALAGDGTATQARISGRKFKLVPPAKVVTLQLRDRAGRYAGPVVVGRKGKNVVLGLRAGVNVGKVKIAKSYGTAAVPRRMVVASIFAAAKGGAPVGAGKLGYVKRPSAGGSALGSDSDHDGIPNAIDVDDDGDLILDHVDPAAARASSVQVQAAPVWSLNVGLETSFLAGDPAVAGYALNMNARNAALPVSNFAAYIDKAIDIRGIIQFLDRDLGVECQEVWCTPFGKASDIEGTKRFPADFPVSGQTYGAAPPVTAFNPDRDSLWNNLNDATTITTISAIRPHTTASQLSPSDVLLMHTPADSGVAWMTNISYFFGTVPALAAWSDGSPTLTNVSYPVARDGPGSQSNPIPLTKGADGHYRLRMSIWPPQGPLGTGAYQTLGHLNYGVFGRTSGPGTKHVINCQQGTITDGSPSGGLPEGSGVYTDLGGDRAVSVSDTITFTTDLSQCVALAGLPAWGPGQPSIEVFVAATSGGSNGTFDVSEGVGFAFKPADEPSGGGGGGGGGGTPPPPASGTWSFQGGSPSQTVNWTVHMNDAGITKLRIQFHTATPIMGHTDPSGWTCSTVTVSNPDDALECTHPTGEAAGTDVSGSVQLKDTGSNGMPVTLTVTKNGTDTTSDMTQG